MDKTLIMKKIDKKRIVKLTKLDSVFPLKVDSNFFLYQWCCDCGTRHIWYFSITDDGKIRVDLARDDMATKMRKELEKLIK